MIIGNGTGLTTEAAMGAKTALLAFADGDLRQALTGSPAGRAEVEHLVRAVLPGYDVEPADNGTLSSDAYPPDDVTYATIVPGAAVVCDRRLMFGGGELPGHLRALGAGRRIILHEMHSVVSSLCFAVWEGGALVRSLALSPDDGIVVDIGEPYDFERPYWAGEHPVEPMPGWPDEGPYPLPFHPLELGSAALRAFFGFIMEGEPHPEDIDAERVELHGFRVFDLAETAAREARYKTLVAAMGPPRRYGLGPDGLWREITTDERSSGAAEGADGQRHEDDQQSGQPGQGL
jgi:hypothetical protein